MKVTGVYVVLDEETQMMLGDALVIESDAPARDAMEHFKADLVNPACALYVRVGGQYKFKDMPWDKEKK